MEKLHKNNSRNMKCPCGSGKKHKKCCLAISQEANSKTVLRYGSDLRISRTLSEALAEKPKVSGNTRLFIDEESSPKLAFFDITVMTRIKFISSEATGNLIQADGTLFSVESADVYSRLAATGSVIITDIPVVRPGKTCSYFKVADKPEKYQNILFPEKYWLSLTDPIPGIKEGAMQDVFHKDAKSKRPLLSARRLAGGHYTNIHGQAFLTASDICTSVYDQFGGLILPEADFEDCLAVDVAADTENVIPDLEI